MPPDRRYDLIHLSITEEESFDGLAEIPTQFEIVARTIETSGQVQWT
jgi:hypothetical protein